MRIARLDFRRYGRFTNTTIDLPQKARDIHVIYGPNEAGKSTSLSAIGDFLFEIRQQTPYNFQHSYQSLRIGARLEEGDRVLEAIRRKGQKDTLRDANDEDVVSEEELKSFLGPVDRAYFERMFNLSHEHLAQGGKEIIEAQDDVGQVLFTAGTGFANSRDILKHIEGEANKLWTKPESQREYYIARNRFKKAQSREQELTITADAWETRKQRLDDAEATYKERRDKYEEVSSELGKLTRIRRVHEPIHERRRLLQEIESLGDVAKLPEDASTRLESAKKQEHDLKISIDSLAPRLAANEKDLSLIEYDKEIVNRGDEIQKLNERRIAVQKGVDELPSRRRELKAKLDTLARLAQEIDWEFTDPGKLLDRLPSRADIDRINNLIVRHGKVETERTNAEEALEKSRSALRDLSDQLTRTRGEEVDVSSLVAVLSVVRDIGDVESQTQILHEQIVGANAAIEMKINSLRPALPPTVEIPTLAIPTRDEVTTYRDKFREWSDRLGKTKARLNDAKDNAERQQLRLELQQKDADIEVSDTLETARAYRDALWNLVDAKYISHSDISETDQTQYADELTSLPDAFKTAIGDVDVITDQRIKKSEVIGKLMELANNIEEELQSVKRLEITISEVEAEGVQIDEDWRNLWANVPIEVLPPDAMFAWVDDISAVKMSLDRKLELERNINHSQEEVIRAVSQVSDELTKVGISERDLSGKTLRVLIEFGEQCANKQAQIAENIRDLQAKLELANNTVEQQKRKLEGIEFEQNEWRDAWKYSVEKIDLSITESTDGISSRVSIIEDMRTPVLEARNLQDNHIADIERDIESFTQSVSTLTSEIAPDLANTDVYRAAIELKQRLDQALDQRTKHEELSSTIREQTHEIEKLELEKESCLLAVKELFDIAKVGTDEELREAIELSDRQRDLNNQLQGLEVSLNKEGDGLDYDELEAQCRDVEVTTLPLQEAELRAEVDDLHTRAVEDHATMKDAKREFEEIAGRDDPAKAIADGEEALATMQVVVERYLRLWLSGTLFKWAIDQYRKEKQGPLLKRSSEIFNRLTLGSFKRLDVGFEDNNTDLKLLGVRPGDTPPIEVSGMSSGTEDQLFLAIRLAAVEDYIHHSVKMPFIADDLFINFDSDRAKAGFEVLGELAEKTQILFFTHHLHLLDLAREVLGRDVPVTMLAPLNEREDGSSPVA